MSKKIVVALGGNALGNTVAEQLQLVAETAISIVDLIESGNQVILVHGNGPQVGMIHLGMNYANEHQIIKTGMPFPECSALSQGYIGFHLQNAIRNELHKRNHKQSVATVITQMLVDEKDPNFRNPTKPIGSFYSKEQAELMNQQGFTMVEDSGRGCRRVIASPKPLDIVEVDMIKDLIHQNHIVIACGGGGIPVIDKDGTYVGVEAVIDKDFAAAKLAELVGADMLIVLTAVDQVAIHYNKPNMKFLDSMTIEEANMYIEEGHFAPGSMLPKVEAAISFVSSGDSRKALITSLEKAKDGILGLTGTILHQ